MRSDLDEHGSLGYVFQGFLEKDGFQEVGDKVVCRGSLSVWVPLIFRERAAYPLLTPGLGLGDDLSTCILGLLLDTLCIMTIHNFKVFLVWLHVVLK